MNDKAPDEFRMPPHDRNAERSVLGSVLRLNRCLDDVLLVIKNKDVFYAPAHRLIFQGMLDLSEQGQPIDLVTLGSLLANRKEVDEIGGYAYLAELWDAAPTAANAEYYAGIVQELRLKRELIHVGTEIYSLAYKVETGTEAVKLAEQKMFALGEELGSGKVVSADEMINKVLDGIDAAADRPQGIYTGFHRLDALTGGLHPRQVTILAARPSCGKTAMALSVIRNVAADGEAVFFASLEQSIFELGERLLSAESGVNGHLFRMNQLTAQQVEKVVEAGGRLRRHKVFIDDGAAQDVMRITSNARRLKRKHDIGLVVIDYLQLISAQYGRNSNREQAVAEVSRGVKHLAKEVGVPVLALCQLNRAVEGRVDSRPRLADLRESGSLEQDADAVLLMWRDDPAGALVNFHLAKQRNGPTGEFSLTFRKECVRFENMAEPFGSMAG